MDFLKSLLTFVVNLIGKNPQLVAQVEIPLGQSKSEEAPKPPGIDWTDAGCHVTEHFTVGDCLTLHSWNRLATEMDGLTDGIKANMVALCGKMEEIRTVLGCPINVHCIYRSPEYNTKVVGAIPNDVHSLGEAIDFDTNECHTIDEVHTILEPLLEQHGLRMERNTISWIHLDTHAVKNARYFTA